MKNDVTFLELSPLELRRYNNWLSGVNSFISLDSGGISIRNSRRILAWLAKIKDVDAGVVVIEVSQDNYGYLRIGVNPDVRRKGVGYLLTEKTLELKEINDFRALRAILDPINTAGIKIVNKYNFQKTGIDENGSTIYEFRSYRY